MKYLIWRHSCRYVDIFIRYFSLLLRTKFLQVGFVGHFVQNTNHVNNAKFGMLYTCFRNNLSSAQSHIYIYLESSKFKSKLYTWSTQHQISKYRTSTPASINSTWVCQRGYSIVDIYFTQDINARRLIGFEFCVMIYFG